MNHTGIIATAKSMHEAINHSMLMEEVRWDPKVKFFLPGLSRY
jgi:hypothetical protein